MPRRHLRTALLIGRLDLQRRFRDRSLLIQGVIGPLILAVIGSLAFRGASIDATIGVADEDRSEVSTAFADALLDGPSQGIGFVAYDDAEAARAAVDGDDVDAAIVVPAGFGESLAGRPAALQVVEAADRPINGDIAAAIASGFADRVDAARLAVATAVTGGADEPPEQLAREAAQIELPARIEIGGRGGAKYELGAYFGASMGIVFLFLTVGAVARSLIAEKRDGVLARIRSAPITDESVLAGKSISVVVLGLLSMLVIWLATSVGLGADWGDAVGVVTLIAASVLAVGAVAGAVASVAKTDQSAEALTAMVTFAFGLVGGNFLTPGDLPSALQFLSRLTPNGWALSGFTELGAADAGVTDILPNVGVLLAMTVVLGAIGAVSMRRRIAS